MSGPNQSRKIGCACRIYKNSNGKVIGIDDISAVGDTVRISSTQFHKSVYMTSKRTLLHLGDNDRTVASIIMMGDYDYVESSGISEDVRDYTAVIWSGDANVGNSEIYLGDLPQVGDTLS